MEKFLEGRTREAASIHRRLLPLVGSLFVIANPVPLKYSLNYLGFPVGKPRLPLIEPDEKSAAAIRTALEACKIDLAIP